MEFRSFDLEKRGTEEQPILQGYAVRWRDVSKPLPFLEKFQRGAFQECLNSNADIMALANHDTGQILARRSNNTLILTEDNEGLKLELQPNINTSYGRDMVALVERRDIAGVSLGFKVRDENWDRQEGKQIRTVNKADVIEVSLVSDPAYAQSSISKRNLKGDEQNMKMEEREVRQKVDELEKRQAELDAKDELTDEEQQEYISNGKQIRQHKESLETTTKDEPKDKRVYATARNPEREKIERRKAFNDYLRTGRIEERNSKLLELSDDAKGGYTAPEDFRGEIIKELADLSAMRQICRIVPPISGRQAAYPKLVDGDGAAFVEEGEAIDEGDVTFGQVTLAPKKVAALVPVSNELLADTGVDLAGFLSTYFAEEIAEVIEDRYLNGDGSNANPTGILDGSTLTRVSAEATGELSIADIIALHNAVPAKYRKTAEWLMHPDLEAEIRTMQDAASRNIFVGDDFSKGMQDRIFGRPIRLSDEFPNTLEAGEDILAFGDFKRAVYIGDSTSLSVQRNESYGFNRDVTYFRAIFRTDIAVAMANAVRVLKMDSG